jgi:hypothetical protein
MIASVLLTERELLCDPLGVRAKSVTGYKVLQRSRTAFIAPAALRQSPKSALK